MAIAMLYDIRKMAEVVIHARVHREDGLGRFII